MALFGRKEGGAQTPQQSSQARPLPGRKAFCRICETEQTFARCWMRVGRVGQCPCCGAHFQDTAAVYRPFQPACPHCGEMLEQPGFEYGLCDGCGSKYELVTGTRPGLLPNKAQRAEMNKLGRVWRHE